MSSNNFPKFGQLPEELRIMIWVFASRQPRAFSYRKTGTPPVAPVLHAVHESRREALRSSFKKFKRISRFLVPARNGRYDYFSMSTDVFIIDAEYRGSLGLRTNRPLLRQFRHIAITSSVRRPRLVWRLPSLETITMLRDREGWSSHDSLITNSPIGPFRVERAERIKVVPDLRWGYLVEDEIPQRVREVGLFLVPASWSSWRFGLF